MNKLLCVTVLLFFAASATMCADPKEDSLVEKLIMEAYQGNQYKKTLESRSDQINHFLKVEELYIRIKQWPNNISVGDPGDETHVSELNDGDRGFIWKISNRQISEIIAKKLKRKAILHVIKRDSDPELTDEIKTWIESLSFDSVVYED